MSYGEGTALKQNLGRVSEVGISDVFHAQNQKILTRQNNMRPLWLGALLAPLAAPLLCAVVLEAASTVMQHGPTQNEWSVTVALVTEFVAPVSYLATWILGVPLVFLLRKREKFDGLRVCLLALSIGVLSSLIYQQMLAVGKPGLAAMILALLLGAALASSVAISFCWICAIPWHGDAHCRYQDKG